VRRARRDPPAPQAGASRRHARENIHRHYDLGNDFYRLWLDDELLYTCAYFPRPDVTLEAAQAAKMRLICRKLRLQPGETVIEAGCGWGALALFMAREFGVTVHAYNISHEQVCYARDRAAREGLQDRVTFIEDDYRAIDGQCDAFVSVGMLEHVGPKHYATLGGVIDRVLAPGGRGLLHFIGRDRPRALNPWIRRRIFPGAYPPTLAEAVGGVLQPFDLTVIDVENLRLHYARTLDHWLDRFEQAADRIRAMFDDRFVRAWRLYLAGSRAAFVTGWMQLFQVTFTRHGETAVPWTRAEWLREESN
jgi:cyclopropane-fatty-acyl-phospholipid synthase